MDKLLYVAIGGGLGSVARYVLSSVTQRASGGPFPLGTLVVNVLGCVVMGALAAVFTGPQRPREELRLALMVGVLGGFTTFSSFAWESVALADSGDRGRAIANVLLTNALCLAGAWIGYRLLQEFHGA